MDSSSPNKNKAENPPSISSSRPELKFVKDGQNNGIGRVSTSGLVLGPPNFSSSSSFSGPSPSSGRRDASGCNQCGKLLIKPSLNPDTKRFCSANCAKASLIKNADSAARHSGAGFQTSNTKVPAAATAASTSFQKFQNKPTYYQDDQDGESSRSSTNDTGDVNHQVESYKPPKKKKKKGEDDSFEWNDLLNGIEFKAASVSQIKHAPLSRMWENVTVGMKLEVENKDVDYRIAETAFWVASVIKIQGYYVLLRYEGFGSDASGDFWMHLCSESVHHVGWCANKGKPLIPPKSIARKFTDWRNFLVNRLTGARTLPLNFHQKVENGLNSQYKIGDSLEVVDKNQISQLRLATVAQVVGRRLHVEYWDTNADGGFWCHEESRLIHPEGWAKTMGHKISCPPNYNPPMIASTPYDAEYESMNLRIGMKLEAIDPLNLSAICAATIKKVLRRGYVMVRIDCYEEDTSGFDWFCYHISSQSVYPCGFCATNGVTLTPPTGYNKATFDWESYFKETNTEAAPLKPKDKVLNHKFKEGMKIEAADLMDPRLICVATISKVVGRLLKIHFDGWEEEYDQWMDARSPDIYPIGWCELVKRRLEPPRPPVPVPKPAPQKKAKKGKRKVTRIGKNQNSKIPPKVESAAKPDTSVINPSELESVKEPIPSGSNDLKSLKGNIESRPPEIVKSEIPGTSFNGKATPSTSSSIKTEVVSEGKATDPNVWNLDEVANFLKANDCSSYCESFAAEGIDGVKLMALSKDEIVLLTGMKVGPAVKIFDLISQLKKTTSAAKARHSALTK